MNTVYSWPDSQTVQVVRGRTGRVRGRERPGLCLEIPSDKGILRVIFQSNRSFNIPSRAHPGHLTPFLTREGGNLINTHQGWGI